MCEVFLFVLSCYGRKWIYSRHVMSSMPIGSRIHVRHESWVKSFVLGSCHSNSSLPQFHLGCWSILWKGAVAGSFDIPYCKAWWKVYIDKWHNDLCCVLFWLWWALAAVVLVRWFMLQWLCFMIVHHVSVCCGGYMSVAFMCVCWVLRFEVSRCVVLAVVDRILDMLRGWIE